MTGIRGRDRWQGLGSDFGAAFSHALLVAFGLTAGFIIAGWVEV